MKRDAGLRFFASAEGETQPITFHHLEAEQMHDLERAHLVAWTGADGRAWEADFSAVMFNEFRLPDAPGAQSIA